MSKSADSHLVAEITDAAARVRLYLALEGRDGFMQQELIYDAVCMNLLRVGECARFLSSSMKTRLPTIPWPDIINLRNRVAHSYETLRPEVLWLIASVDLPELASALQGAAEGQD